MDQPLPQHGTPSIRSMFELCRPMPVTRGTKTLAWQLRFGARQRVRWQQGLVSERCGFLAHAMALLMSAKEVPPALGTCVQCTMKVVSRGSGSHVSFSSTSTRKEAIVLGSGKRLLSVSCGRNVAV